MRKLIRIGLFIVLAWSFPAYALERFDIVTTQQLVQMLEDRDAGKIDFLLLNSLDEMIYRNASIPGSVNVPWSRIKELQGRLGQDKDRLIVTY